MSLQNNNINKQETQKRILIATLISFAFFIAYDFLYIRPQQKALSDQNVQAKQVQQEKTDSAEQNSAPAAVQSAEIQNEAPVVKGGSIGSAIATVKTANNIIEIDSLGRIAQVTLKGDVYVTEDKKQITLFKRNQLRPLEVRFSDRKINTAAFETNYAASTAEVDATASKQSLTLTQKLGSTTVTKKFTFYPAGHYDISIDVTNEKDFFVTTGFRPNVLVDMYADHGALLKMSDKTSTIVEDEDLDKTVNFKKVTVASAFDRYYATVLYNFNTSMIVSLMPDEEDNPQIFIHGSDKLELHGYLGPKEYNTLNELHKDLTDVIEYGWFTFLAKPMFLILQYIHNLVGNWGWTIVVLTILVKLLLYPLSYKGMVSMQKLKDLAPKVKEIQERYKGDSQKASAHMMELYKKHGANPMGGCLPILLQIPVFFAIYRVLLNAIELKGAEWILWIEDLALMDPYFVLPVLMGLTMFVQQKITPNTIQDETQRRIFQYLPVIFTFFFLWFPAGLTLYWFINNLFTVGQQYYINKLFEKQKSLKK